MHLLSKKQLSASDIVYEQVSVLCSHGHSIAVGFKTEVGQSVPFSDGGGFKLEHDFEIALWVSEPDYFVVRTTGVDLTELLGHLFPVDGGYC